MKVRRKVKESESNGQAKRRPKLEAKLKKVKLMFRLKEDKS